MTAHACHCIPLCLEPNAMLRSGNAVGYAGGRPWPVLLQCSCHSSNLNVLKHGRPPRPASVNLRPTQQVWRSTACKVHASHWQQLPQQGSALQQRNVQRAKLWDLLDIGASLGAVSAAIAFVFTAEAMLAGMPVVLPLVAMYASRQRQRLQAEVRQRFA